MCRRSREEAHRRSAGSSWARRRWSAPVDAGRLGAVRMANPLQRPAWRRGNMHPRRALGADPGMDSPQRLVGTDRLPAYRTQQEFPTSGIARPDACPRLRSPAPGAEHPRRTTDHYRSRVCCADRSRRRVPSNRCPRLRARREFQSVDKKHIPGASVMTVEGRGAVGCNIGCSVARASGDRPMRCERRGSTLGTQS
jgi:hypothetical protein